MSSNNGKVVLLWESEWGGNAWNISSSTLEDLVGFNKDAGLRSVFRLGLIVKIVISRVRMSWRTFAQTFFLQWMQYIW